MTAVQQVMYFAQQQYTHPQSGNQASTDLLSKIVDSHQQQQVQFNRQLDIEERKLLPLESIDQRKRNKASTLSGITEDQLT